MQYPRPAARWVARRLFGNSLTPTTGVVRVPGLRERVEIYRDARGVPHIEAPDRESLFVAQGYCHAQDRLWQMEFNRRMCAGRLAEVFGDRPLDWEDLTVHMKGYSLPRLDAFMRTMGLAHAAAGAVAHLTASERALLDAYARGINLYLDAYADRLPPEFHILRHTPEPWVPADSLCIAKGLEFQLSFSWRTKLVRAGIAARLAAQPDKAAALDFAYPGHAPTILRYLGAEATAAIAEGLTAVETAARTFAGWAGPHAGSNNWVVGGAKTASGKPLVCNDPHLALTAPGVWYQCQLRGGGLDAVGVSVPGLPGIGIGHNHRIAWGITNVTADDADYYIEKFNPKDPNQVKEGRRWVDLETREEVIRVKGQRERRITVRTSRNGPLVSDFLADFTRQEVGHGLSLKWVGQAPSTGVETQVKLNAAETYEDFREALRGWTMGVFNFVYGDRDGHIAYQMAGRLPARPNGPNRVPVPGWIEKHQWAAYVPFDELPATLDPPEGYLATANNKTVGEEYPHYISDFFEPPHRATRIHELIGSRRDLTADAMRRAQFDTVSIYARTVVNQVLRPLEADLRGGSAEVGRALDLLLGWDADFHASSRAAALFAHLHQAVLQRLFAQALGEHLWAAYFEILNECIPPVEAVLCDPDNPWWAGRDRTALLHDLLGEAWWACVNALGPDPAAWTWGALHQLVLPHPLATAAPLRALFGIGPLATGGDGLTVNNGTYLYRRPFRHFSGPSMRFVCNLGDFDDSWLVTCSGQSGNPLSPHYADQAELWVQGVGQPLVHAPEDYRLGELLVLIPENVQPSANGDGRPAHSTAGTTA